MTDGWTHWPDDPFPGPHDTPGLYHGRDGGLGDGMHDAPGLDDGPSGDPDHGWSAAVEGPDPGPGSDPEQDAGPGDGVPEHGSNPVDSGHGGTDLDHPRSGPHDLTGQPHPEPPAETAAETVVGDAIGDAVGDSAGPHLDVAAFPPRLDLDISPADGRDWVDVDLLGEPDHDDAVRFASPADLLADLHRSDGADGEASWPAVTGSDDPAVRALAMRWRR